MGRSLRLERCGRGGFGGGLGWEEVVAVGLDGVADGAAPAVGAIGVDEFVLGNANGLQEGLREIGDGASGFGFYIAADDRGDDARQGGAEIAGGEVAAGEEVGQLVAEFLGGEALGFFLGMVEAKVGMGGDARGAATAAVGEGEETQGYAVLCFNRRHKNLLGFEFLDLLNGKKRAQAGMPVLLKQSAPALPGRSGQQRYCITGRHPQTLLRD